MASIFCIHSLAKAKTNHLQYGQSFLFFHNTFIMALSKSDLVAAIASSTGATKKMAGDMLEALLSAITKELSSGGSVTLTGFGTFKVSDRAARTGVNPQNPSQKIQIAATTVPSFKAGKVLKESVKKGNKK